MTRIPVFVSAPKSYLIRQEKFLNEIELLLGSHDLRPTTLGRSDYDMDAPLEAIRRLMASSCGLICVAFRRTFIEHGRDRPSSDKNEKEQSKDGAWLTSSYSQIEPAMAYQIGLPILLWREEGVVADGIFDRGSVGLSMPVFDLDAPPNLSHSEWGQPLREWIDRVRSVYRKRGTPPRLW